MQDLKLPKKLPMHAYTMKEIEGAAMDGELFQALSDMNICLESNDSESIMLYVEGTTLVGACTHYNISHVELLVKNDELIELAGLIELVDGIDECYAVSDYTRKIEASYSVSFILNALRDLRLDCAINELTSDLVRSKPTKLQKIERAAIKSGKFSEVDVILFASMLNTISAADLENKLGL